MRLGAPVGASILALAGLAAAHGVTAADPLQSALRGIRPEALRAHVRFLADDRLEGRRTGTRGHEIAARYVAAHFEAIGLEPAGRDGTYFQHVPLRRGEVVAGGSALTLTSRGRVQSLAYGREFALLPDLVREKVDVSASVAYVGFGVSAPELRHDDYAHVDTRGKVVAVLIGAPASFPADQRAYHSSRQLKTEQAARHGAVGILFILPPEEERRSPFSRMVERLQGGTMSWLDEQGHPDGALEGLRGTALLSRAGAEALFSGSRRSLEDAFDRAAAGKTASFELPAEARIRTESRQTAVESYNVLGVLRGSDSSVAREHLVMSGHLDHLGIGTPKDGDAIYNGAFDNASGTGGVLEVARALAGLPGRPRRSVLFAALTGEEEGLLGAEYLAHSPPVQIADIVANLNMDMFLTLYPIRDIVAFGGEHSSLGVAVRQAAPRLGLEVSPDPFPEEVVFIRSDHYAFVRKGVPSLMLACGLKSADPAIDGGAILRDWLRTVYHTPKDDLSQPMDFESAATIARLYLLIAHGVAQDPGRPSWNPGDFFGARFAR
jgi:Zn-dependent M28 family amino/carboxypeptidase